MSSRAYQIEFGGLNYMLFRGAQVLAEFFYCEDAYAAKRNLETKRSISSWEKLPLEAFGEKSTLLLMVEGFFKLFYRRIKAYRMYAIDLVFNRLIISL